MITKEEAIDILEKFDFFQGQRAGRELWNYKPFDIQEQDINNFSKDVALLKEYIAEVAPKNEVDWLEKENARLLRAVEYNHSVLEQEVEDAKSEVAREIFERLHAHIKYDGHTLSVWKNDLICIAKEYDIDLEKFEDDLRNFRLIPKKYTEEGK